MSFSDNRYPLFRDMLYGDARTSEELGGQHPPRRRRRLARDPRVPWHAKALALAVAAYALSPIDLIPDFIPVLGYLDDLVIVPLGIMLVVHLIPAELMAEFRAESARRVSRPRSLVAARVIVAIWITAAALLLWWLWPPRARMS